MKHDIPTRPEDRAVAANAAEELTTLRGLHRTLELSTSGDFQRFASELETMRPAIEEALSELKDAVEDTVFLVLPPLRTRREASAIQGGEGSG